MSRIYIFCREPSDEKLVKIDVCKDYLSELNNLNDQLKNVGDTTHHFSVFATFDIDGDNLTSNKLLMELQNVIPHRRYANLSKTYYSITPEEAFNIISAFVDFSEFKHETNLLGGSLETKRSKIKNKGSNGSVKNKKIAKSPSKKRSIKNQIDKNVALNFLQKNGVHFDNDNITFGSINSTTPSYWMNPQVYCIEDDWYIILNDFENQIFHLFLVPKGSIKFEDLKTRIKRKALCFQINIAFNDDNYTDKTSGETFVQFKIGDYPYKIDSVWQNPSESDDHTNTNFAGNKSLDKFQKPAFIKLNSFCYSGQRYKVSNWVQMLDRVMEIAYERDSSTLFKLANSESSPFGGNKCYFTTDIVVKNKYHNAHQIYDSGIYYEVNICQADLCLFIKWIIKKCGFKEEDFSISYYGTDPRCHI